ncbi:uncharacterized protein LOC119838805 [Zerene cesonia]|uniref:uncharacterized protein LOC119838805 n=1 Tax=Zerene cesonia TaxID=33412 RepID=UPI0018E4ED08|nr:uncharacterized protein LOC119838805 [Zerene cesonia]
MMLIMILCGLSVAVNGGPQHFHRNYFPGWEMDSFWRDFDRKFEVFDDQMDRLYGSIENIDTGDRIVGDNYEITMVMSGFKEDEISVKVRQGQLVVEGHSDDGSINIYNSRSLPPYVGASGTWTYENNVLKIVFPIIHGNNPVSEKEHRPNVVDKTHVIVSTGANNEGKEVLKANQRRNLGDEVEIIQT